MSTCISSNLIQPALTIIGWAVMIFWAIKHLDMSAAKNLKIQQDLIQQNHERELAKEIINIYKDLAISLENFLQAGNLFTTNLKLEKSDIKTTLNITASNLVEPINIAYNKVCSDINRLDMWLKIAPSLPHIDDINKVIQEYKQDFSISDKESEKPVWLNFQVTLSIYQAGSLSNTDKLFQEWTEVGKSIFAIRHNLIDAVSSVNIAILNAYNK